MSLEARFEDLEKYTEIRLQALSSELEQRSKELHEARQEIDHLKRQHQFELDSLLREKKEAQLQASALHKELDDSKATAENSQAEYELALLQLHQLSEELEHQYLLGSKKSEILQNSTKQYSELLSLILVQNL